MHFFKTGPQFHNFCIVFIKDELQVTSYVYCNVRALYHIYFHTRYLSLYSCIAHCLLQLPYKKLDEIDADSTLFKAFYNNPRNVHQS